MRTDEMCLEGSDTCRPDCPVEPHADSDGHVASSAAVTTAAQRTSPALVTSLSNVIPIAAGASHSCAVTSTYDVYSWDDNSNGQLGDGTTTQRLSPIHVGSL